MNLKIQISSYMNFYTINYRHVLCFFVYIALQWQKEEGNVHVLCCVGNFCLLTTRERKLQVSLIFSLNVFNRFCHARESYQILNFHSEMKKLEKNPSG